MRFTIDSNQKAFFRLNHHVEFEDLITDQECQRLMDEIQKKSKEFISYSLNSLPMLPSLIRRRQLAEIAYELCGKKPLRLKESLFAPSILSKPLEEDEWGLFLFLSGEKKKHGIYFSQEMPERLDLYNTHDQCYLLFIFTAKYLLDEHHPIVLR